MQNKKLLRNNHYRNICTVLCGAVDLLSMICFLQTLSITTRIYTISGGVMGSVSYSYMGCEWDVSGMISW